MSSKFDGIVNVNMNANPIRSGASVIKGEPGKQIELGKHEEYLVWRYVGDTAWRILVNMSELKGASSYEIWLELGNEGDESAFLTDIVDTSLAVLNLVTQVDSKADKTNTITINGITQELGDNPIFTFSGDGGSVTINTDWNTITNKPESFSATVSPDADNTVESRDNGIYVPPADGVTSYTELSDIPEEFKPEAHEHVVADIKDFEEVGGEKGEKGEKGDKGDTGAQGKSTFKTWQEAGHEGDENSFLRWVKASAGGNANIGEIFAWALDIPPGDSLMCDGSEVSRTEYAKLFDVIGTTFGDGDGSTTFNLPDMRYEGRDLHWCIRYNVKQLPWCSGVIANRSISTGWNTFNPIVTKGDMSLLKDGKLVVTESGTWGFFGDGAGLLNTPTTSGTPMFISVRFANADTDSSIIIDRSFCVHNFNGIASGFVVGNVNPPDYAEYRIHSPSNNTGFQTGNTPRFWLGRMS